MKQFSYFWLSMSLAFGIGGGLLIADGVRLASAAFVAKMHAEEREQQRKQEAARRAKQAEIARKQEEERRQKRAEKNRVYQQQKQQFRQRNNKLEITNNYLNELQADCENAHARNRAQPSRENTELADEACASYEAEKQRLKSKSRTDNRPLRIQ